MFVDVATPIAYAPRTFATAAQVRDFVEATPAAWGYVDLAFAASLHALTLRGRAVRARHDPHAAPIPHSARSGVVTRGRPRGALARFLRWVGDQPQGARR